MNEDRISNWRNLSDENREKAFQIAKQFITPERAEWIRQRHAKPDVFGTQLDHFGWGMALRNAFREAGLTDDKIHGNWDDFYVDIALLAVGIPVPKKHENGMPSVYGGLTEEEREELGIRYRRKFIENMRGIGIADLDVSDAEKVTESELKHICVAGLEKLGFPELLIALTKDGQFNLNYEMFAEYIESRR